MGLCRCGLWDALLNVPGRRCHRRPRIGIGRSGVGVGGSRIRIGRPRIGIGGVRISRTGVIGQPDEGGTESKSKAHAAAVTITTTTTAALGHCRTAHHGPENEQ